MVGDDAWDATGWVLTHAPVSWTILPELMVLRQESSSS